MGFSFSLAGAMKAPLGWDVPASATPGTGSRSPEQPGDSGLQLTEELPAFENSDHT